MPDYKKGQIYRIVCNITGKIYVGSTTQSLSVRLAEHRRKYKLFKEGKRRNVTSFQIIEQGNYEIVLIENFPCESKIELHRRERHFIETLQCVNKYIPTRTNKEWYADNKERITVRKKAYNEKNQAHNAAYNKTYKEVNRERIAEREKEKVKCECGCEVTKGKLTKHKRTKKHLCRMTL